MPDAPPIMERDPCSLKFFYCCCEVPEIDTIGYRERPIILFIKHGDEEYKGPKSKMVPIRRCVVCGGFQRRRCPECAYFEYKTEQPFNDYCYSCETSKNFLFEKVRTFDEGQVLEGQLLEHEIAVYEARDMMPTPEQLKAFLELHPEWENEDFNQYRASQFRAFCQGWIYVINVKSEEEPVHA